MFHNPRLLLFHSAAWVIAAPHSSHSGRDGADYAGMPGKLPAVQVCSHRRAALRHSQPGPLLSAGRLGPGGTQPVQLYDAAAGGTDPAIMDAQLCKPARKRPHRNIRCYRGHWLSTPGGPSLALAFCAGPIQEQCLA